MPATKTSFSVAATSEECLRYHRSSPHQDGWCNATFDSILCWPPTAPVTEQLLPCPPFKGVDPNKFARRFCLEEGLWRGRSHRETLLGGWTNYSDCFIPEVKKLMDQLYSSSGDDAGKKLTIAWVGRILEMVGLSVSFCCILICLFLFCYFRRLRNSRTRIHIHLFTAILVLVVLRLTLYIDQYIIRTGGSGVDGTERGIDNTPVLCELFYVLQEWARSATFLWMFLEGYYLHSTLTRDVFNEKPNFIVYSLVGWGLSILLTSIWAIVMACLYTETQCWWGKHVSLLYWIIQGPRFMVIAANLGFLLNILRVLVTKLHESSSNDVQKVRKAVRAALFLLPLLGITHSLEMFEPPLDRSVAVFGCYTIVLAVLDSFQGFYISLLYCFLNQEVRDAVVKQWHDMSVQRQLNGRRPSHIDRKLSCRLLHLNSVRMDGDVTLPRTGTTDDAS